MTDNEHDADTCPYPWCTAHTMCDCPYADIHPHRAAGCRYATTDQDDE